MGAQELMGIVESILKYLYINLVKPFRLAYNQTSFNLRGIKLGRKVEIRQGVKAGKGVKIGNNVTLGDNSSLSYVIIGDDSVVESGAILLGSEEKSITIGENTYIGFYATIEGFGGLEIGDNVHIAGPSVGIWTHSSVYQCLLGDDLRDHTNRTLAPVKIENNVWIGGKTTVYPGVCIGHHSIILPNSVVNKNVPPFSVVGGVPAYLRKRIVLKGSSVELIDVNKI